MQKRIIAVILSSVLLLSLALPLWAEVTSVAEPTAGQTVYVSGNPDMYPVEYYDKEAEGYFGIVPELFRRISERTGLVFSYIRAGEKNEQSRISQNGQAEVISAHRKGEVGGLAEEIEIFSYVQGDETVHVCIGFTKIMDEKTASLIRGEIEGLSEKELLEFSIYASEHRKESVDILPFLIIIAVLAVAGAVLAAVLIRGKIKAGRLQQTKMTDPLCGIGNGEYFRYCFENHISPASYVLYYIAYISLDIRQVEKYLGTTEAENIQQYAANILSSSAADTDFEARIDEGVFAVAFQCPSVEDAEVRVNELLHKLNNYEEKFLEEYHVLFRAGFFHLNSPNIPYETALYNAKQGYKYAVRDNLFAVLSDAELLNREALKSKLERKLADALKNKEFKLYLQFILDSKAGVFCGAEALARWQDPEEGLLPPSHFIDSMKTARIIDRLDFYVFEESCRILEEWSKNGKDGLWLSCNFTRITVSRADFLQRFEEIISRYSFDRRNMIIELTEDSLADNKALAFQNVLDCKKLGVQVALDDLGSGYSSFSDLCDYPVDIIKIDRHIVAKSVTQRGNALLHGITELAHNLGIRVLCEGVENEAENGNALSAECDYIQGYFYSRVMPPEDAVAFYEKDKHRRQQ